VRTRRLLIPICLLGATPSRAAAPADEPWTDSCRRAREVALPAGDQPDPPKRKALAGCSSEELFYGIGRRADPDEARLCAYVERADGDQAVFGGSAMLMTMYATGIGAHRNLPLAIRFACALDGAPAEMEARIAHLEALAAGRAQPAGAATFDLCDDITSGFMQGICAAHDERMERAKRDQRRAARLATWTPSERAAFGSLRATADDFFRARSDNEVDQSGTGRAAFRIEEEAELEKSFDALLELLERGAVPRASADDFVRADRALNDVYRRVMSTEDPSWGTVTKEGIRRTERTWLKYRDGWVALAKVKFPRADAGAIKTWLTRKRVAMLGDFAPEQP
jgi:hypothetical protein